MEHLPLHKLWIFPNLSRLSKEKVQYTQRCIILRQGGSAVDAVEVAVRHLEDDPTFDAGHGSVLTEELTVEVDAMIMDGNTLESGTKVLWFLATYG